MTFYTFYDNEWAQKHICRALILAAMELATLRAEGLLDRESWSLPNPARVQRNSFLKAAWTFGLFGAIALLLSRMSEPFCPNKTPRKTLGTFWSSYICWLNGFLVWHKLSETCEKRWRRLRTAIGDQRYGSDIFMMSMDLFHFVSMFSEDHFGHNVQLSVDRNVDMQRVLLWPPWIWRERESGRLV